MHGYPQAYKVVLKKGWNSTRGVVVHFLDMTCGCDVVGARAQETLVCHVKRRLGTQGVRFFPNGRFLGNGKGVDVVPGTLYSRKARVRSFFSARFFREREGGRLPILNKGGVFGKVLVARERERERAFRKYHGRLQHPSPLSGKELEKKRSRTQRSRPSRYT